MKMSTKNSDRCRVDNTNQFWLHYLSLEKALEEISEYVAIHESNKKVFSFKIMQLYFSVCSEIDSIFKHIRSNIPDYTDTNTKDDNLTIKEHKAMIEKHFHGVKKTKVNLNISGYSLKFQPFKVLFDSHRIKKEEQDKEKDKYDSNKFEGWWSDYNSVKHNRLNSFRKANLDNLLHSLSALHILNLVYAVTLESQWVKNYDSVLIEAPATSHYPIFQLKNSGSNRYTNSAHSYYASRLNNNSIR